MKKINNPDHQPKSANNTNSTNYDKTNWKSQYPPQNKGSYYPPQHQAYQNQYRQNPTKQPNQSPYPNQPLNNPPYFNQQPYTNKRPYPNQNSYANQNGYYPQYSNGRQQRPFNSNQSYNNSHFPNHIPAKPPQKESKAKKIFIRIAIVFLALLILLLIGLILVWNYIFSDAKTNRPLNTNPSQNAAAPSKVEEPMETNAVVRDGKIINILLMGMDLTHGAETSRADAIILATIDQEHEEIRLTSFQRDMMVHYAGTNIDGKLNGTTRQSPEVLVNTLNQTFHLDIKDYIMVDIAGAEDLVNAVDGIEVNLSDDPAVIKYMNRLIVEQNSNRYGWDDRTNWSPKIQKGGLQKLNGTQAIAYARMRELDSDFFRMKRQQEVIQLTFKKLLKSNPFVMANTLKKGLSYVTSNMSSIEMTQMGLSLIPKMKNPIKRFQVPIQGYYWSDNGGSWNIRANFNLMIPILHQFIYGETIGEFTSVPLFPYTPLDWTDTTVMPKGVKEGSYTGEPYVGANGDPGGKTLNGADMVSELPDDSGN